MARWQDGDRRRAGLISTADDFNAFAQMMLNSGRAGNERILSRPSIELMTTDQLTSVQKQSSEHFFGNNRGWGFGLSVFTKRDNLYASPGRFGWDGGYGTSWYSDPSEQLTGILPTQRMMDPPPPPSAFVDFGPRRISRSTTESFQDSLTGHVGLAEARSSNRGSRNFGAEYARSEMKCQAELNDAIYGDCEGRQE